MSQTTISTIATITKKKRRLFFFVGVLAHVFPLEEA
jgi:hypothetical protein